MELKLRIKDEARAHETGLNRTFMELKLPIICYICKTKIRLNRTFMELKLDSRWILVAVVLVLIEPLWN